MKKLKRIGVAVVWTAILGIGAYGDSPCPPPAPGQTDTPPCSTTYVVGDEVADTGQTSTPPNSDSTDVVAVIEDVIIRLLLF